MADSIVPYAQPNDVGALFEYNAGGGIPTGAPTDFGGWLPSYTLGYGNMIIDPLNFTAMPANEYFGRQVAQWLPAMFPQYANPGAVPTQANASGVHPTQPAPTPQALAAAREDLRRMNFQVDDATGSLVLNGRVVGDRDATEKLTELLRAPETADPGTLQRIMQGVGDALSKVNGAVDDVSKTTLGKIALTLGLGAAGVGVGQMFAGGNRRINLPPPPGPGPEQQAAQRAFGNVLATGGATSGVPGGTGGTGTPSALSGFATPNLAGPFLQTGQQNLEDTFRSGIAGQSILSQLAALQAARELGISTEQAPYEAALRNLSMAQLPQFMTPPATGRSSVLDMMRGADGSYSLAPNIAAMRPPMGRPDDTMYANPGMPRFAQAPEDRMYANPGMATHQRPAEPMMFANPAMPRGAGDRMFANPGMPGTPDRVRPDDRMYANPDQPGDELYRPLRPAPPGDRMYANPGMPMPGRPWPPGTGGMEPVPVDPLDPPASPAPWLTNPADDRTKMSERQRPAEPRLGIGDFEQAQILRIRYPEATDQQIALMLRYPDKARVIAAYPSMTEADFETRVVAHNAPQPSQGTGVPQMMATLTPPAQRPVLSAPLMPPATMAGANDWIPRINDPIRAAFASEIARAAGGATASPMLQRMEQEEEQQLRNRLQAQLGAGYEVSSPGIEAMQRMRESQAIRRENNRQQTYANLAPQEFARRGAEYQVPLTAANTLTNIDLANRGFDSRERQTGLAERLAMLNIGRTPVPQISTTLNSLVPISPLLGLDSADRARQQQHALQTQAALQSYGSSAQSDQALAAAIAGLFGTAAGSFR